MNKRSQKVKYLDELEEIIKGNNENFEELSEEDEILVSKSIDLIKSTKRLLQAFYRGISKLDTIRQQE